MAMKKLATLFTSFVLSLSVFAAVPPVTFYTDVDNPIAWEVTTYAGNTPTITVGIQTNGGAYTGLGAGWSAYLNYGKNNYASALKTITGTVAAATGIVTFNCLTNSFPASGDYFAEVYLQNTDASKITTGQGVIRVKKSPSAGSYGDLNLSPRINWDILVNLGTVPWSDFSTNFLQSQISANLTSANATSVVFQALHDAQAATNALKVDIATFNATNALKVDIATFNATNALKVDVTTFNATNALKVDMADYIIVTNLFTTGKVDLVTFNATNALKVDTAVFNATNALKVDLVTFNATNALKVDVATFNATNVLKTDLSIYSVATNLLSTGKVDLVTFKATNVVLQSEIDDKYPSSNPSNFLTTTDNRFDHLYVADLSVLGANIGTNNLAQGVYTGVVNSTIAYTGSVGVVAGRTYAYGYSKIYSSGTSTLSIAGNSIVLTAAESDSNFFTYHLGEGSNLVITLVGTPSALCSASNIYVCQSTNGDASAARDFNVGRRLIVDGAIFTGTDTNAVWGNITGTLANQLDLTNTVAKAASALQASDLSDLEAATNALNIATNALNTATNALNTLKLDASETNGWEIGSHAGLATGTPLYVESDPNYAVQSNAILTHTESAHEVTAEGGFQAGTGAAVGLGGAGGAIGITAGVIGGGAVGDSAYAWDGGAVGKNAYTLGGGAIGDSAKTGYGFAGGRSAFATSNGLYSGEGIDAIQLGGGGNTNAGTLGVYDFQLQDAGGNVPLARMTNALVSVSGTAAEALATANAASATLAASASGWEQAVTDSGTWTNNALSWDDGNGLTNLDLTALNAATNALNTATNALNTAVTSLNAATNALNTYATNAVLKSGNHVMTGNLTAGDITATNQVYVSKGLADNSAVNREQLYDLLAEASVSTLYGSTNFNAFGLSGSWLSAPDENTTIFTNAFTSANETLKVGTFWMTNSTALIRAGTYNGVFHAERATGNGTCYSYIELVYTDDDGATTNLISTSNPSGTIIEHTEYRVTAININNIEDTSLYLGASVYIVKTAGSQATDILLFQGASHPSRMETPGFGETDIGTRGATNLVFTGDWNTGVWNSTTRSITVADPGYTASIFPVLRLDLGGQWTDFELKATTNNFTSLCYYYISSEDNAVADDTNVWVYFTDDYHADPRQWIRQIIGLDRSIYDQLENPYSVVKSVYVYPSHNCAEDWEEWMSKSNTNLVWSYVRFDGVDYEKNYDDTGARWTTVQPSEWIAERVYVAETSGVTNSVLTNKVDVLQAPYMGELGGTNGVYWTVGSDKYWILFE